MTLVLPVPAGGATDVAIRVLARATEPHLGQPIVVESRPGAGATLGTTQVAAARPDGYTLAIATSGIFRLPFVTRTTFDPAQDLTYVVGVSGFTFGVVVGAEGNADTNNALLGGHIHAVADGTGWGSLVDEGKFRLLVTWGANRTRSWPSVPTLRETGIDMVVNSPYGITGPKGIDPNVVKFLHDAFKKGMDDPSFAAIVAKLDQEIIYLNSADYERFARQQIVEQKRIIEELGLKPE